ncbi:MAG: TlyA family RNA methyltransferase [Firmicutes bacterium]|nr:TlyA family RNA methyltransferase [Bacillota bacterium]
MCAEGPPPGRGGARGGRAEGRVRVDVLLVERGLARSRTEAQGLVIEGRVRVDGRPVAKPGLKVEPGAGLELEPPSRRYVSRGGLKLEKALDFFGLDVTGLDCLDVGASTGGFTDCLLRRGARRVYAVDVGYGLLAWSLQTDPRVVVLDRTNARHLEPESFRRAAEARLAGRPADGDREFRWPTFATCDVSFISLLKVFPAVATVLREPWQAVLLVKPQFEAGRELVGPRGVVRDPEVHVDVLEAVAGGLARLGWPARGLTYSPIRGPEGNLEYLLLLARGPVAAGPGLHGTREEAAAGAVTRVLVERVVADAFAALAGKS